MTNQVTLLKWIKKRDKIRKLGKLKFSIYFGLIQGVAFAIGMPLINWLFFTENHDLISLTREYLTFHPLYACLFYSFFMFLFDYLIYWNIMENQYQKWIKERDKVL